MIEFIYAPILKFKEGEIKGYGNLTSFEKDKMLPIFDLIDNDNEEKIIKKIIKCDIKTIGLDVFKVFNCTNSKFLNKLYLEAKKDNINIIPVINLKDYNIIDNIDKLASPIVGVRITLPLGFDAPFSYADVFEILNNIDKTTLLIIDVEDINDENINLKFSILETFINELKNALYSTNVKIIVSSNSFPTDINEVEKGDYEFFDRKEIKLFNFLKNRHKLDFIYSDYGVTKYVENNLDFSKINGSKILAKIRYTLEDRYLIYRGRNASGIESKIGYKTLATNLVNSVHYKGEGYSLGDKKIKEISQGDKEDGGKGTTWVMISTNHHLTLVLKQLGR